MIFGTVHVIDIVSIFYHTKHHVGGLCLGGHFQRPGGFYNNPIIISQFGAHDSAVIHAGPDDLFDDYAAHARLREGKRQRAGRRVCAAARHPKVARSEAYAA